MKKYFFYRSKKLNVDNFWNKKVLLFCYFTIKSLTDVVYN